jgi:hypothetical protein
MLFFDTLEGGNLTHTKRPYRAVPITSTEIQDAAVLRKVDNLATFVADNPSLESAFRKLESPIREIRGSTIPCYRGNRWFLEA